MSGLVWICMVFYTNLYCLVQFSTVPYWLVLSTTVLFSPSGSCMDPVQRSMVMNCLGWPFSGPIWSWVILYEAVWFWMELFCLVRLCVVLYVPVCSCTCERSMFQIVLYSLVWFYVELYILICIVWPTQLCTIRACCIMKKSKNFDAIYACV